MNLRSLSTELERDQEMNDEQKQEVDSVPSPMEGELRNRLTSNLPRKMTGEEGRREEKSALLKSLSSVFTRRNQESSVGEQRVRTSMDMPLFRDVMADRWNSGVEGHGNQNIQQDKAVEILVASPQSEEGENAEEEWRALDHVVRKRSIRHNWSYKTVNSSYYSSHSQFDDNQSINSNYRVNDSPLSSDNSDEDILEFGPGRERVLHKRWPYELSQSPSSGRLLSPPSRVGSINVREMASFLERTDSFIRRFQAGGDASKTRPGLVTEVPAKPFISRQVTERFSWNSGISSQSLQGGGSQQDGVLMIEQGVELERENRHLRSRLLDMQKRLEKSEKENLRLRERIKRLKLLCGNLDHESIEEESMTGSSSTSKVILLSPHSYEYSQQSMTDLLLNMGFAEDVVKQVTVQLELEYQR